MTEKPVSRPQGRKAAAAAPPVEFRPMRRVRQQMADDEATALLRSATSGVLSVAGDGGYPYGVPLSHVYRDGHLYFHCALRGHKLDALRRNPRACFTVIAADEVHPERFTTYFRSVVCFGRVRIVDDGQEKMAAARLIGQRCAGGDEAGLQQELRKGFAAMLVMDFVIDHITGKQAKELVGQGGR